MKDCLRTLALMLLAASLLAAHDTWLVPVAWMAGAEPLRVVAGQPVKLALNTSEDFPKSEAAPTPDRIARFDVLSAAGSAAVTGYRVEGQLLVAEVTPGEGLTLVAAVTHPRLIVMKPEDFNQYLEEEDLHDILAERAARGQTQAEGRERYSKVAKLALCATAGSKSASFDTRLGLPLELVPEKDPCRLRAGDTFYVRVLFQGKPLAGIWVSAGYPGIHGHDYADFVLTDSSGLATLTPDRPGPWFVRVLHMAPSSEFEDADWQSWFSTLTFWVE